MIIDSVLKGSYSDHPEVHGQQKHDTVFFSSHEQSNFTDKLSFFFLFINSIFTAVESVFKTFDSLPTYLLIHYLPQSI